MITIYSTDNNDEPSTNAVLAFETEENHYQSTPLQQSMYRIVV